MASRSPRDGQRSRTQTVGSFPVLIGQAARPTLRAMPLDWEQVIVDSADSTGTPEPSSDERTRSRSVGVV